MNFLINSLVCKKNKLFTRYKSENEKLKYKKFDVRIIRSQNSKADSTISKFGWIKYNIYTHVYKIRNVKFKSRLKLNRP